MRQCGPCALCCKLVPVAALGKKAGDWCEHCTRTSCRIWHESYRPAACAEYTCLWLRRQDFPDDLRPDRSGVVFEYVDEQTAIGLVDPTTPSAWKMGLASDLIRSMLRNGIDCVIGIGSAKHVLLSSRGRTPQEVFNALGAALNKERQWEPQPTRLT